MKHSRLTYLVLMAACPVWVGGVGCRSTEAQRRAQRSRDDGAPKAGEKAPEFTLSTLDGKRSVDLVTLRQQRPVVLLFGSYT